MADNSGVYPMVGDTVFDGDRPVAHITAVRQEDGQYKATVQRYNSTDEPKEEFIRLGAGRWELGENLQERRAQPQGIRVSDVPVAAPKPVG